MQNQGWAFGIPFRFYKEIPETETETRERLWIQWQTYRDRLLDRLDLVLGRQDIINGLRDVAMLGPGYGAATEELQRVIGDQDYLATIAPVRRRVIELFKRATNLRRLTLSHFGLFKQELQALLSLGHLHTLKIDSCDYNGGQLYPLYSSVKNFHFVISDFAYISTWFLLRDFPDIRLLTIDGRNFTTIFPELEGDDDDFEFITFRSLERLADHTQAPAMMSA